MHVVEGIISSQLSLVSYTRESTQVGPDYISCDWLP